MGRCQGLYLRFQDNLNVVRGFVRGVLSKNHLERDGKIPQVLFVHEGFVHLLSDLLRGGLIQVLVYDLGDPVFLPTPREGLSIKELHDGMLYGMDEIFMKEALKEAHKACASGEVPVGAVLVHEERIIARGYNQVELLKDGTAHAEMLCLTAGTVALDNWRLSGTTLYCTLEPCTMCAGAMFLSRIDRLVYGAPDLRHGAHGSWIDLFKRKHPTHQIEVKPGVLADEAAALMVDFFRERRAASIT